MRSGTGRIVARYILNGNFFTFDVHTFELAMRGGVDALAEHFRCSRNAAFHLHRKLRREHAAGRYTVTPYPTV